MNQGIKLVQPLLWVDLEMTGLNVKVDKILEFACVLTDGDLSTSIVGPSFIIHASQEEIDCMDEWCKTQFKKSGLDQQALASKTSIQECEAAILKFLADNGVAKKQALIAGNSIGVDKGFIDVQMPLLRDYLHYRMVDVSTIKELARRWNPSILTQAPAKQGLHRALDDILESIEELKYYKQSFFKL